MVQDGEHIGLVGPNGCGKSTFLKMLLGKVIPDTWNLETNGDMKIGFLDQYADINAGFTVYGFLDSVFDGLYELDRQADEIYKHLNDLSEKEQMKAVSRAQRIFDLLNEKQFDRIQKKIDNVLSGLGFTEEDRDKPVSILSGGMKTKLVLAKLLLQNNDILILDEPTNFLDIGYISWLGDYLCRLESAYIVISHDKAFLNKVSTKIIEIANHTFKVYNGKHTIPLSIDCNILYACR
jgi:ATPase subunit of ABC transporter with duplicated ATPase domains